MRRSRFGAAVAAAALTAGLVGCGGRGEPEPAPAPSAASAPSPSPAPQGRPEGTATRGTPATARVSTTRLSCPADLVPVTIADRYHYPRPWRTPRAALTAQLSMHGYEEGNAAWRRPATFDRRRDSARSVTYLGRRTDRSVAVELRIERQSDPAGWAPTTRRSCAPPRRAPTALQAAMDSGSDPQVTCDPGYEAVLVQAGTRPRPGAPSAEAALRAFLAERGGRVSGAEVVAESQFVRLRDDPAQPERARFAGRRADGSWAVVAGFVRAGGAWHWGGDVFTCSPEEL